MEFRRAVETDLSPLKALYRTLVTDLDSRGIHIWDDAYPMEFLHMDLEKNRLWVLTEGEEPVGAVALCKSDPGKMFIQWTSPDAPALYMARLGVALEKQRCGLGYTLMEHAITAARAQGAKYLRLFVAECNAPAIRLYERMGFQQMPGLYELRIDESMVLYERGYEIAL